MRRIVRWLQIGLVALLLLASQAGAAAAQTGMDSDRVARATVFIMQSRRIGDHVVITCVGSGTLVSRDGLILTNAHTVVQGDTCTGDEILISLSTRLDSPPLPRFQAEIVTANDGLDLALLRIVRQNDGRVINPGSLALPFVDLGDSDSVQLDDTVTVVGYAGIGEEPVTAERGTIVGFSVEPSVNNTSWMKTSAPARGVMAGGGAYNGDGQLVGVITTAPVQRNAPGATCITIQDTNFDNAINGLDDCVVIGGAINVLRPSNFVQPLLRAASLNLRITSPDITANAATSAEAPSFAYLGFAPSVSPSGMPTTIIRSLPSGSDNLYLFFDYTGLTPENIYELQVTIDGVPSPNLSISPVRWSGGQRGLWYIGTTGQVLPNGVYEFSLLLDGQPAANGRIVVGAPPEQTAQFSDLVFGLLDAQGNALGNGFVLPTGTTASAQFLFRNIQPGTPWAFIWFYEGREVDRSIDGLTWLESNGSNGSTTISIQDENGLLPGNYRLILYIDNRIATLSDFTLAGALDQGRAAIFANQRFTTADTIAAARRAAPIGSFSAGVRALYALFDWQRIAPGTLIEMRWRVDGDLFYQQVVTWNNAESGSNFVLQLTAPGGLPDGTYQLDLIVNQLSFSTAQARVGIGQLPINRFAETTGVQMSGQLLDSATEQGIVGASVFVVGEDYSVADFTRDWTQAQVYAQATTDSVGRFQIDRLLQRNAPYSIVIIAEGYLPVLQDGVELNDKTYPDLTNPPIDISLYMTRG